MSFSFALKEVLPGFFGIVKTLESLKTHMFYCNCEFPDVIFYVSAQIVQRNVREST